MRIPHRPPPVSRDERPFVRVDLPGKAKKQSRSKSAARYLELADIALGIRCKRKSKPAPPPADLTH